jgi:transcriptional regulator with XRE-family HTH domain
VRFVEDRKSGGKRRRGPGVPLPGLLRLRVVRGYTVRALAEASGVTPSTISKLERGRRGAQVSTVHKLAAALDADPGMLLDPPVGATRAGGGGEE